MARPQVSAFVALSLDGCMARPDGGLDWLSRVQDADGEDYGYHAFMDTVDALILGRTTYETVLSFGGWPFGERPVTVLTHRPLESQYGETAHAGALRPLLLRAEMAGIRRIYLDGGTAIRLGLEENVVDDITLSWIPVVLGSGIRLFESGLPESDWQLTHSQVYETGLVQAIYQRQPSA